MKIKFIIFLIYVSSANLFAQDLTMQGGDLSFSIGAGKNRYFEKEFDLFAPMTFPVNINYGINRYVELGLLYHPVIFTDRSNVDLGRGEEARNQSLGGIQAFGGSTKISVYNEYGIFGYLEAGAAYSSLRKDQYIEGVFNEKRGTGYQLFGGLGARYQLGDEYGEIYPWFFEISLMWVRHDYTIDSYKIASELQPRSDDDWDDLKFPSLDVFIKFGYQFRTKKK